MIRVRLAADCPWPQGYSSHDVRVAWAPGEVREVPAELAGYLTSTFPAVFVEHHDLKPVARVLDEAVEAERAPRKRRG